MIFTLIKNELIKLMKKGKTWIVFGLFFALVALTIFGAYRTDQNIRKWNTPENQLQQAESMLEYTNSELKRYESGEASKTGEKADPNYIESLKAQKVMYENSIVEYKKMIETGVDENIWKVEIEQQLAQQKSNVETYKQYTDKWAVQNRIEAQAEIERLTYLKDNNIKLINSWEYEANNFTTNLFQLLGMAILVCGIAVFMSDIVSGECTPATLKFLLIQPVTRGKVLFSKFVAVTLTVLSMILGVELLGIGFVNLTSKISGGNYPIRLGVLYEKTIGEGGETIINAVAGSGSLATNSELLLKSLLFQALFIVTTCAVVFLISTLFKSSMITMALSVVVTVFLTIGSNIIAPLQKIAAFLFVNYGNVREVITGHIAAQFREPKMTVSFGIIVMVVTIIVAYAVAHFNFKKKDILI